MNKDRSVTISNDGSHTLYSSKYQAHYHSVFGAIEESSHVFISAGLYYLHQRQKNNISIFEMGFGTGLNAFLTAVKSSGSKLHINYETVESDPLELSEIQKLNYVDKIPDSGSIFDKLHASKWNVTNRITDKFQFSKFHTKIEDHDFQNTYDLIYWDAFAPSCQSFLWDREIHQRIYEHLNAYGILVSYCSNSNFRKVLEKIGYQIEFLNGPSKKREMIRAHKK